MPEVFPPYVLKRNNRSRHIRVTVSAGGFVRVSAPKRASEFLIKNFLASKADWLREKVEYFKKIPERGPSLSKFQEKKLFALHKEKAIALAEKKVNYWNAICKFSVGRVAVRNSRSRWGSCSSKGTLCFNYKICFLPEHLADYLVVHELCHLKERNHSDAFWRLVAQFIPDCVACRRELRGFDKTFYLADGAV